jgi:hypothetical protein
MEKVANIIAKHIDGIASSYHVKVRLGVVEAINSTFLDPPRPRL